MVRLFKALLCVATLAACGHSEPYVWVDSLPQAVASPPPSYVIGPGDVLAIRVWEQDGMSTRAKVRDDGRISFPLLDELVAAGKTPVELSRSLEEVLRAKRLLNNPRVTVSVEEQHPESVVVMGEVTHAGSFQLAHGAGLLQALAIAGGLTEFAADDRIFVVRQGPPLQRIRFKYRDLLKADGRASQFHLAGGDVVVVE